MPESAPQAGLAESRIVLGVTGGIAAYKAVELASSLVQAGAQVRVAMTTSATEFVQPLTFAGITHQQVLTGVFDGWSDGGTGHVDLARTANVLVIAPATANSIARLAHGLVDDMLSAIALATEAPLVVAPAMEHHMWLHPATQQNVATLRSRGASIIGPAEGRLASGATGYGRLAPLPVLLHGIRRALGSRGPLAGRKIVVTAGGTREAIDPVRYIGNRSSGQMGIALAEAAVDLGATVQLIATNSVDHSLYGGEVEVVESARDLEHAVQRATAGADVLIMAAAVADFRPATTADHKIKKQAGQETMAIDLVRNPDIIAGIEGDHLLKVGFAAETDDLVANAQQKLHSKGLAMIVANEAVATIGSSRSQATLISRKGDPQVLPEAGKDVVARAVLAEVARLLTARIGDD
jgi:phosphopantothenoylcysteine decarboxylase/phosphopantothenate--cysteine ligase